MTQDPYKYFRIEAPELLDQLGRGVLDLEKGGAASGRISHLLRLAHTLKGAARVVNLVAISDLAHAVEDVLTPFRDGGAPVPRAEVDRLLQILDAIQERYRAISSPPGERPEPVDQGPHDPEPSSLRADVAELDAIVDGMGEVHVQLAAVRRCAGAAERVRHLSELLIAHLGAARAQPAAADPSTVRARSVAEELKGLVATLERDLAGGVDRTDRELHQVRQAAERLRLLPAGIVFDALERAARDAARSVGKRVAFVGTGGETRLDAHVVGVVQGALVQLVRNAVAHGIETEAERLAAGKPPEGRVELEVTRRGSRVRFACRDDGRGVDLEAVRRVAQKKGWSPPRSEQVGAEQLVQLLLEGGITTSGHVTEVSGRGIGLDVVRASARRLGGAVSARTEAGRGTAIELEVPVTLASLDALIVEAAGRTAAIALEAVQRTLRVTGTDLVRTPSGESILFEGRTIPFVPLARALRAGTGAAAPRAWSAVIVGNGSAVAAVGVDRLAGTANVVVRPLPALAAVDPIVAGASLDAQGNPRIVLDTEALIAEAQRADASSPAPPRTRPRILVVDDSLTTRMLEQSILESAGYDVDLAISGEDALEKAHARRYALFLVDVEMPGMDGFTFVEQARADALLRDVPAILVTSRSATEDRRRGERVGARGYIVKSEFDQADLIERVRVLVA